MIKVLLVAMMVYTSFAVKAQNAALNCGNGRYVNNVFTNVTKTSNIIFGYNTSTDYTTATTYNNTLQLDFYEPAGDPAIKRPLVILAFGGSFITGQRSDLDSLCIALSKKGYATATIDYRLIYPNFSNIFLVYSTATLLADELVKASADMKAAIRFFKRDAATTNTYRIDPTKIIVGGGSSGAITALQTAYTDDITENPTITPQYLANGGFEGNTDLPAPNNLLPAYNATGIAAVLNISGGVSDTNLVDVFNPPIYSSQGDADEVVPYNYGPISFNGIPTTTFLYGSHLIQTRANNIGLKNQLYTIPGGSHTTPGTEPYISQIVAGASAFLEPIVCPSALPVALTSFTVKNNNCTAELRWKTATEQQSSHYEIETSPDGIRFTKSGIIQSRNIAGGAEYAYNFQAFTGSAWFRLKIVNMDGGFTYSSIQKVYLLCGASVQVSPNPAQYQALVTGLKNGMQVDLVNAEGRLLWTQKPAGNTLNIPMSAMARGLYMVKVRDVDGKTLSSTKLVKN